MEGHDFLKSFFVCFLLHYQTGISETQTIPCLTWKTNNSELQLLLRSDNLSFPVSFTDPKQRKIAECNKTVEQIICQPFYKDVNITHYITENTTILSIRKTDKKGLNGEWVVAAGNVLRYTNVLTSLGIYSATDLIFSGTINYRKNTTTLSCSSCWNVFENTVDILIDNKSNDSIRYYKGGCFNTIERCNPNVCSCISAGHMFIYKFGLPRMGQRFSCFAKFKDEYTGKEFSIKKTLIYNGKDLVLNGSEKVLTEKPTDEHERNPDKQNDHTVIITVVCVIIVTLFLLISASLYCKLKSNREYKENIEERTPLLAGTTEEVTYECETSEGMNTKALKNAKKERVFAYCLYGKGDEEFAEKLQCFLQTVVKQRVYANDVIKNKIKKKTLKWAIHLIVIVPSGNELMFDYTKEFEKNVSFFRKHHSSGEIIAILPSQKDCCPDYLKGSSTVVFKGSFEKIVGLVLRNANVRNLSEILLTETLHPYTEARTVDILEQWGVTVESKRVNFYMHKLQIATNEQHICITDMFESLYKETKFTCIRLYDVVQFDLEYMRSSRKSLYKDLIKILKFIRDREDNRWWYHYRRNGLTDLDSSEKAFNLFKEILLERKEPFNDYDETETRLSTFENFPIQSRTFRTKLSEAGFFSVYVSDYSQCFCCRLCLRNWNETEDPVIKHQIYFPNCDFIQSVTSQKYSMQDMKEWRSDKLSTIEGRIQSFEVLVPNHLEREEISFIADAGFYYIGIGHDIVCYSCNIGFIHRKDYKHLLQLHKRYSPNCEHLKSRSIEETPTTDFETQQYLELEYIRHAKK